jgi:hypothetical protein
MAGRTEENNIISWKCQILAGEREASGEKEEE